MVLYFLRHGDAVASPTLHDADRPLSEAGHREISRVASFLSGHRIAIDWVVSSPLLRARETATHIAERLALQSSEISEYLVPGSDPRQLAGLINGLDTRSILLVGHEPHLSGTIAWLIGESKSPHIEMRKASLACVEIHSPLRRGQGILRWLIPVHLLPSPEFQAPEEL
ncbi:MAG: phosphohistidine phosphatase SixA [Bacteroidota bacterium]